MAANVITTYEATSPKLFNIAIVVFNESESLGLVSVILNRTELSSNIR